MRHQTAHRLAHGLAGVSAKVQAMDANGQDAFKAIGKESQEHLAFIAEVAVEGADAHFGRGGDVVCRGRLEAPFLKQARGSRQDSVALLTAAGLLWHAM